MKILFLTPASANNFDKLCPPIGLCYLSAVLKKNKHQSKVIDNIELKDIDIIIRNENPDIIGLQVLTIERENVYNLARYIKKINPNIMIIVGGQHASVYPEYMFKLMPIDYVVIGEGEITIIELINYIENNNIDIEKIKGISYKNGHQTIINPKRELIENLDDIPFPDYSDIDFKNYSNGIFKGTNVPIMTSRGCPHSCKFCSSTFYWGNRYRQRTAQNVVDEIEILYTSGIKYFNFYDDNFIVNKKRLNLIMELLKERNIDIEFSVATSSKVIDEDRIKWLKSMGCINIGFGMESGSMKILKNINKNQNINDIRNAVKLAKKYDIRINVSLIVGNMGENDETLIETATLLNELFPNSLNYAGILWILAGTEVEKIAIESGNFISGEWLYNHDDIYYTMEYSINELKDMQLRLLWYQARNRSLRQKLSYLIWHIHIKSPKKIQNIYRYVYYTIFKYYVKSR